jgi:hypothetical protein
MNDMQQTEKRKRITTPPTTARAPYWLFQDWEHVSRWITQNLRNRPRSAFNLRPLPLPSLALVAYLALLLALTTACAWLGTTLTLGREIGRVSFFQRMPSGDLVWIHRFRGRAFNLADLPQSGNSPGDMFQTYQGVWWVWIDRGDGTAPTWVDP